MSDEHEEDGVQATMAIPDDDAASQSWLERSYREHASSVFRTAYRITGDASDAEDVLQTVFLRLSRRMDGPPDFSRGAGPYLRRAATNAALDLVTSARVRTTGALEDLPDHLAEDSSPRPDALHAGRELAVRLRTALGRLNRRAAEMFALRYFEDLDNAAIARLFDTTPGTVAVTLHRTRSRLADELRPSLGESK
jgi:RNA polymerase sigma-70 factor, ECF subfamily